MGFATFPFDPPALPKLSLSTVSSCLNYATPHFLKRFRVLKNRLRKSLLARDLMLRLEQSLKTDNIRSQCVRTSVLLRHVDWWNWWRIRLMLVMCLALPLSESCLKCSAIYSNDKSKLLCCELGIILRICETSSLEKCFSFCSSAPPLGRESKRKSLRSKHVQIFTQPNRLVAGGLFVCGFLFLLFRPVLQWANVQGQKGTVCFTLSVYLYFSFLIPHSPLCVSNDAKLIL